MLKFTPVMSYIQHFIDGCVGWINEVHAKIFRVFWEHNRNTEGKVSCLLTINNLTLLKMVLYSYQLPVCFRHFSNKIEAYNEHKISNFAILRFLHGIIASKHSNLFIAFCFKWYVVWSFQLLKKEKNYSGNLKLLET